MSTRSVSSISEALALAESYLDSSRGATLVRRGKGGKGRGAAAMPVSGSFQPLGVADVTRIKCLDEITEEPL